MAWPKGSAATAACAAPPTAAARASAVHWTLRGAVACMSHGEELPAGTS